MIYVYLCIIVNDAIQKKYLRCFDRRAFFEAEIVSQWSPVARSLSFLYQQRAVIGTATD